MKTVREVMAEFFGEDFEKQAYYAWSIKKGNPYIEGDKDLLVVNKAWRDSRYGDNDPMYMANYAVLSDEWAHLEGFDNQTPRGWDARYVTLELDSPAGECWTSITDALDELESVGYLDDGDYYHEAEEELLEEHWDGYGRDDLRYALEKKFGEDAVEDTSDETLDELARDWWYDNEYPHMIDVSCFAFFTIDMAKDLTLEGIKG